MTKKCMGFLKTYCGEEIITEDEIRFNNKVIVFDSEKELEEYARCFIDQSLYVVDPYDPNDWSYNLDLFISYEEVKKILAAEKEKRRLWLKPCPFCGKEPQRKDTLAVCETCMITLPDHKWNDRKYYW